jgi:hypothetical protein
MTRVLYIVMAGLLLAESLGSFGLGAVLASSVEQAGSNVIQSLGFLGLLGGVLLTCSAAVAVPQLETSSRTRSIALISFFYGTWGLLKGVPPHLQYALPDATGGLGAVLCSLGFVAIGGLGLVVLLMERRNSPDISEVS